MMKIRILFPTVILLVIIGLIITTMGYPEKARLFPLLVALPVAVLLVLDILREALGKPKAAGQEIALLGLLRRHFGVVVWLIFFALIIYLLGLLAGASLYLFLYLRLHGEKWPATLIYVLAVSIVMYGVFELAFNIPLYRGVFFE